MRFHFPLHAHRAVIRLARRNRAAASVRAQIPRQLALLGESELAALGAGRSGGRDGGDGRPGDWGDAATGRRGGGNFAIDGRLSGRPDDPVG